MSIWTEHRNPEGRTYWFNTGTRESVWEKPDDLKTPFERALNQTKWKEYFSGGRKYYYNTDTKESKWDMPDELLLVLEKVEKEGPAGAPTPSTSAQITAPGFTPVGSTQGANVLMGGADPSSSTLASQHNGQHANGVALDLSVGAHTGGLPLAPTSILPARPNLPDDPVIPHNGFATVEEGEKAFMHLLRKAGVDANWTWDQTMRAIITDPLYKALNTLAEKKATWEKFTTNLKAKEQEEREARLSKLRPAIRNLLKGNPNVFHYTTFPTGDKLFAQHPIWAQAKIEAERRLIFEEYVAELKQRDVAESRAARARSVAKVVNLFKELNVDVVTRWRNAHTMVLDSAEWNEDAELRKLPTLDILLAFEDYSRVREREYEDQMRKAQVEKTRKERKAREAFKDLLQGLVDEGKIKARSKWKEVYHEFADDARYLSMLGNPGSNPLELFWDAVDVLDQELDRKIAIVVEGPFAKHNANSSGHLNEKYGEEQDKEVGFVVTPDMTEEEFGKVVEAHRDEAVDSLTKGDLHMVYTTLHNAALKKQAEDKRRAERKQRHLQDDLRYAMKKLPEPLDIALPYEEIVPLIQHLPEYAAVEDEDGRRSAFAKYVKRQKERMREVASEDGASTTSRKRKEPPREHKDRERERDREPRDRDRDRERERAKESYDRPSKDERGGSSRHHRHEERRSSRDYGRDKEDAHFKEYTKSSGKHSYHRDEEHERRKEKSSDDREGRRYATREWEEAPRERARERSASVYREDMREREKRDVYEDRIQDERAEKRPRYEREHRSPAVSDRSVTGVRAETPEEGEI